MYCGLHALTVIELPGGEIVHSRDFYVDVKVQKVIEVIGRGKFLTYESHFQFEQEKSRFEMPVLLAPHYFQRLKVRAGDFDNVETDARYLSGTELRPDEREVLPKMRVTLGPPDFVQIPLNEARTLHAEVDAARTGQLSESVRRRLTAATVYIQCVYASTQDKFTVSGSGFLINPRGYIVTNGHVVTPTDTDTKTNVQYQLERVDITLYSGIKNERTVPARVIWQRDDPDLALLKIEDTGLDFLCLEDAPVSISDPVIAVGYPGGRRLVFAGINPNVSFRAGQITAIRAATFPKHYYYEHSAPIEQGNSGGPLITPRGTVIGVNTFLSGPQLQSRFAASKDTIKGFLFQESAEGKGPYTGPSSDERYTIFIARVNTIWMNLDSQLFQLTKFVLHIPLNEGEQALTRDQVQTIGLDTIETLNILSQTLEFVSPSALHRLSHTKICEGLRIQKEAVEKLVRLIADEADDKYVGPAKAQQDTRTQWDKDREGGQLTNDIQAGRTQLCFAFNRVIGMFWASNEQVTNPEPPLPLAAKLDKYSPEAEQHLLNEVANVFQRHRGNRVAILRLPVDRWTRQIVYPDGLVTGSEAMLRELSHIVRANNWDTGTL